MTFTKLLAGAAALALLAATPSASFAFGRGGGGHMGGGMGGARFAGGGHWAGGGGWHGGHRGGWIPGAVAGAVIGGAIANSYAFYGGPGYGYGPDYYSDNTYYDAGPDSDVVTVVPAGGDPSYCAQRYRSWDPASQTYLGFDGLRHPCP